MNWLDWWPLTWRSSIRALERENYTLRDALRNSNEELRQHRKLISALRDGNVDVTLAVHRLLEKQP